MVFDVVTDADQPIRYDVDHRAGVATTPPSPPFAFPGAAMKRALS